MPSKPTEGAKLLRALLETGKSARTTQASKQDRVSAINGRGVGT
jgi:hypothetical protein